MNSPDLNHQWPAAGVFSASLSEWDVDQLVRATEERRRLRAIGSGDLLGVSNVPKWEAGQQAGSIA